MASPAAFNIVRAQISPSDEAAATSELIPTPIRPSSRRTRSLSSCSSLPSSSPSIDDSPLFAPTTPLRFTGIPFSWERFPGVPKKQVPKEKDFPSLPLPPARTPKTSPKKSNFQRKYSDKDPFFTALVECSKDNNPGKDLYPIGSSTIFKESRVNRTSSGRFGFISEKASCKSSCGVSESIIFVPRPG
ncbi:hypothetical protein Vadar_014559 [Vaccinium darrowii]|uniref:Uncharacterized protein n=1 Tax=Vaccinium darrowii TaxID=229202 RepID=A0ACB7X0Q9_9ERIC|nr:hypothetical protein Vadar_014559 [Vaccinium darrowii]